MENVVTMAKTSPQYRARLIKAIEETAQYIQREEARREDIRPPAVAERLAFYRAHKAKLLNALVSAA